MQPTEHIYDIWYWHQQANFRTEAESSSAVDRSYVYDEQSKYEENGKKTGHYDSTDWESDYRSSSNAVEFVSFASPYSELWIRGGTGNSSWSVHETTTTLHGDHNFDMGTASGKTETMSETSSTPPVEGTVPINPHHYGDWPKFEAYTPSSVWVDAAGGFWAGLKYGGATVISKVPFGDRPFDLDKLGDDAGLDETTRRLTNGFATGGFIALDGAVTLSTGGSNKFLLGAARAIDRLEKLERVVNTVELAAAGDYEALGKQAAVKLISTQLGAKNGKAARTGPLHGKPVQANLQFNGPGIGDAPVGGRAIHGNSRNSKRPAHLYRLEDDDGNLLKHGVSQNPDKRYTKGYMEGKNLIKIEVGPRDKMLDKERRLTETNPGPLNREPWAGKRLGESP